MTKNQKAIAEAIRQARGKAQGKEEHDALDRVTWILVDILFPVDDAYAPRSGDAFFNATVEGTVKRPRKQA